MPVSRAKPVKLADTRASPDGPMVESAPRSSWKDYLTPAQLKEEEEQDIKRNKNAVKSKKEEVQQKERKDSEAAQQFKEEQEELQKVRKCVKDPKKTGIVKVINACISHDLEDNELDDYIYTSYEYYCMWCNKQLGLWQVRAHHESGGHLRKESWNAPQKQQHLSISMDPCAAMVGINSDSTQDEEWDKDIFEEVSDEWGGKYWRCRACDKVADESHCASKMHTSRVASWKEMDQVKVQPLQEWLMWVWWGTSGEDHDMNVKCLLCDKFCQDGVVASNHGKDLEAASKEHKRRIQNYKDYRDQVREQRKQILQEDRSGKLLKIVQRQTKKLDSLQSLNNSNQACRDVFSQLPAGQSAQKARQKSATVPTPASVPKPKFERNSESEPNDDAVDVTVSNWIVHCDYEADEMKDGEPETGYLKIKKGENLVALDTVFVAGESHNSFSSYGYFKNEQGDCGWSPVACLKEICS